MFSTKKLNDFNHFGKLPQSVLSLNFGRVRQGRLRTLNKKESETLEYNQIRSPQFISLNLKTTDSLA